MNEFIKSTFKIVIDMAKKEPVQLAIVFGGVAITLVNMFIATKLAPIAENITTINQKVDANTQRVLNDEKYIPQFVQLQQSVTDITPRLDRIESKVDSIDSFLRGYK